MTKILKVEHFGIGDYTATEPDGAYTLHRRLNGVVKYAQIFGFILDVSELRYIAQSDARKIADNHGVIVLDGATADA